MNASEMLDKAQKILARQDVDRALLLFFLNAARRAVIRDKDLPRFYRYLADVPHTGGVIDKTALNIKAVKAVEWDNGLKYSLKKLDDYQQARRHYPDFTLPGQPHHYFELGQHVTILPTPQSGAINILAEVWPPDLADSVASSDALTVEIPEAWVYLAVAEYFDYFDENEKGRYWRQKGMALTEQYIAQLSSQYMDNADTTLRGYYSHSYRPPDY